MIELFSRVTVLLGAATISLLVGILAHVEAVILLVALLASGAFMFAATSRETIDEEAVDRASAPPDTSEILSALRTSSRSIPLALPTAGLVAVVWLIAPPASGVLAGVLLALGIRELIAALMLRAHERLHGIRMFYRAAPRFWQGRHGLELYCQKH